MRQQWKPTQPLWAPNLNILILFYSVKFVLVQLKLAKNQSYSFICTIQRVCQWNLIYEQMDRSFCNIHYMFMTNSPLVRFFRWGHGVILYLKTRLLYFLYMLASLLINPISERSLSVWNRIVIDFRQTDWKMPLCMIDKITWYLIKQRSPIIILVWEETIF